VSDDTESIEWRKERYDDGSYFLHSEDCPNFCEYACGGQFYNEAGQRISDTGIVLESQ